MNQPSSPGDSRRIVVYGSVHVDVTARVPRIPAPGETVAGTSGPIRSLGGKGANVARTLAALGSSPRLIAAVGSDADGEAALASLDAEGVDIGSCISADDPTGTAFIVVDDHGENTIVVASGAAAAWTNEDLSRLAFGPRDMLVAQLELGSALVAEVLASARAAGAVTVLNASPIADAADPYLREALECTDILIVNLGEATRLAQDGPLEFRAPGRREEEPVALIRRIRNRGPETVIVTRGADGIDAVDAEGRSHHVDAVKARVVDTTGAGDAACAGLVHALARGTTLKTALTLAAAAGSAACETAGAQAPTRQLAARGVPGHEVGGGAGLVNGENFGLSGDI